MQDEEKPYLIVLNLVKNAHKGYPFSIRREWAEQIKRDFNLTLKRRNGDMTGELSAMFEFEGEPIRLKLNWMRRFELYHGDWESDPHWTGD